MKVSMTKHGGQLAALYLGKPPKTVNTDHLPAVKGGELTALVCAAAAGAASPGPRKPRPDETTYTITVDDGAKKNVLKQSDSTMTSPFQALVDWIEQQPS